MELDCDRKCLEKDKPGTGVGSLQLCLVGYGNPGASPNSRTGKYTPPPKGKVVTDFTDILNPPRWSGMASVRR